VRVTLIPWNNVQITNLATGVRLGLSSGEFCLQLSALWASARKAVWSAANSCNPDRILIISQVIAVPSPGTKIQVSKRITKRSVVGLLASEGGITPPDGAKVPTGFTGNGHYTAWIVPFGPFSPGNLEIYDPHKARLTLSPQAQASTFALGSTALIWTRPGGPVIANDLVDGDETPLLLFPVRPAVYPLAPIAAWGNRVAWVQPRSRSPRFPGFLVETYTVQ